MFVVRPCLSSLALRDLGRSQNISKQLVIATHLLKCFRKQASLILAALAQATLPVVEVEETLLQSIS